MVTLLPDLPTSETSRRIANRVAFIATAVPVVLVIAGLAWIEFTARRYQRATGRQLYGLAAYHYSDEPKMEYHPGGEMILQKALLTPAKITFGALILSFLVSLGAGRELPGWYMPLAWLLHIGCFLAFGAAFVYYYVNIIGVFI